jgi:predicted glutamine amidotransferase
MCGIAGIYVRSERTKLNLDAILNTMLTEIEDRGGDATGYLAMTPEGVGEWQRAACDVPDFIKYRRSVPVGTRTILAHTRWATQGLAAFMENNHPIRRGPFYVIHNGHVSNDWELFKLSGRERFAQVDTEAISAYIAHLGELSKVGEAMEKVEGAAAIAVVDERYPDQLVLARGYQSPLNVLVTDKVVMWGSTERTVRMAYKKHIGKLPRRQKIEALAEGRMLIVTPHGVEQVEFKAYDPPSYNWGGKTVYQGGGKGWAWVPESAKASCEVIPPARTLEQDGHFWDEDDDDSELEWSAEDILSLEKSTDCDECGGQVTLMNVVRVPEPDSDFEWKLCEDCADLWERLADEQFSKVNDAILSEQDR